jgi:hypothetical protein
MTQGKVSTKRSKQKSAMMGKLLPLKKERTVSEYRYQTQKNFEELPNIPSSLKNYTRSNT